MRKKLNPGVVVVCMFAITAAILCVMFAMQAHTMRQVYGSEIRKDIFTINDLTAAILEIVPDADADPSDTDPAALLFSAGSMERCDLGGRIHEQYDSLRTTAIQAVQAYSQAVYDQTYSQEALQKLADHARTAVRQLRSATQYLMSELNSTDVDQMNYAYYSAMDVDAKVYKRLTHFIETELPNS